MGALDGRSAIVTGGATGLGRAFVEALAGEGASVTFCDLLAESPDIAAEVPGPGRVQGIVADVSKLDDLRRLTAAAQDAFGGVDILVNNAGRWRRTPVTDPYEKASADWDFIMDTNLMGVLLLSRLCVPLLIEAGGGDIVNISTYYVLPARSPGTNNPDTDLYNASKWALNGFTQAWSRSLGAHNVRVNALCMGATDTAMLRGLWDGEPPAEQVAAWIRPDQIAQQLLDLLADGRSGENIGAWVGEPVQLGPRKPAHRTVTG
ncbi:MAG: SDR family NAD(P)-dependent oxidoreductase [Gammaproteobacteria bacterium]|nr:SDR family NAD(P)-dependent oxidoreductase [Gammaproteobacteria bacterium]